MTYIDWSGREQEDPEMERTYPCRVHLCNRKSVPDSNLCDAHFRQIVDRMSDRKPEITESEARALDGNR